MKNTIYRYFFYEFLRLFAITLFALALVVWTIQSVNFLDLVTEDGHAFKTYFIYSSLTLSKVLTKLIPFSFLVATVFTIIKFEKDNELITIWTSGLNKIYIVNLIVRISLMVMILQIFLASTINPTLLNLSRSILKNSELQFMSSLMKEKQFNDTLDGITIFVDRKDENGIYKNLFIQDDNSVLSKVGNTSSTIFAQSAYITEDNKKLVLYNGNIQKQQPDASVDIVKFKKTVLDLSNLATKSIVEPKIQETSTKIIFDCLIKRNLNLHNCTENKKSMMDIKIEFNKRFGMPIFIPLIALVCSFLLSSRRDQKLYNYNKYIYIFICLSILIFSEILVRYSGISWTHSFIYYLAPFLMFPLIYLGLIKKFKYENLF